MVAKEYFSKTFCPKPSALENSNGNQKEGFSLMCFALLIKEKTMVILNSLNRNLWTHSGHCSFTFLCAKLSTWQIENISFLIVVSTYILKDDNQQVWQYIQSRP